jgi:hypothetical protein
VKQIVLKRALSARPVAADFELIDTKAPECPAGGVVIRVAAISLDPYVGSRLRGRHMGEAPPRPGIDPIPAQVVGTVIESRASGVVAGDVVATAEGAWAAMTAIPAGHFRKVDRTVVPLSLHVGVLGMPGLTAWAGITQLAKVGAGDVVLIDAAAGPVGGTAGQIARLMGAKRVVGIAGGADKCKLVVERYRFDACVDYTKEGWTNALDEALPEPPTVHFENVSTAMASLALQKLKPYGRIVLCGLVDQYHADAPPPQLNAGMIIGKRAQVSGLVVYDFYPRYAEFTAQAAQWIADRKVVAVEDKVHGLHAAPALFEKLMAGRNMGKAVVELIAGDQL